MTNFIPPNTLVINSDNLDGTLDSAQFGFSYPLYTWRKGGTLDAADNHLYLFLGGAHEEVKRDENVLIEVVPDSKEVKFYGKTTLNGTVAFDKGTLEGEVIVPHSITSDLLENDIVIDGKVSKLTNITNHDGIEFDGTNDVVRFAVCSTESSENHKEVTIPFYNNKEGAIIDVLFKHPLVGSFAIVVSNGNIQFPSRIVKYSTDEGVLENVDGSLLKTNRIYQLVAYGDDTFILVGELNQTSKDIEETLEESLGKVYQENRGDDDVDYPLIFKFSNQVHETSISPNSFGFDFTEEGHTLDSGLWNIKDSLVFDNVGFGLLNYNPKNNRLTVGTIKSTTGGLISDFSKEKGTAIFINSSNPQSGLMSYAAKDCYLHIFGTKKGELKAISIPAVNINNPNAGTTITFIDKDGNSEFKRIKAEYVDSTSDKAVKDQLGRTIDTTYLTQTAAALTYITPNQAVRFTQTITVPPITNEANCTVSTVGYSESFATAAAQATYEYTPNTVKDPKFTDDQKAMIRNQIGAADVDTVIGELPVYTRIDGGDLDA